MSRAVVKSGLAVFALLVVPLFTPVGAALTVPVPLAEYGRSGTSGLGEAVAVSGEWMVVGAPLDSENGFRSGAVHMYKRAGTGWVHHEKIPSWALVTGGLFGSAVALGDGWLAVGAPAEPHSSGHGWVYLYRLVGDAWQKAQFFNGDSWGRTLGFHGDMLLVGMPFDHAQEPFGGSVRTFRLSGDTWFAAGTLYPSAPQPYARFGSNLDLSGGRVAIAAIGTDAAFVFERNGHVWLETARITSPLDVVRLYGIGIALDGDTLVLSTPNGNRFDLLGTHWGAVRVYQRSGGTWVLQQELTAREGDRGSGFGGSVALHGDTLVVGAPTEDRGSTDSTGAAYVFTRAGSLFVQQATLDPPRVQERARFGAGLAVLDTEILIGTPGDHTYDTAAGVVVSYASGSLA